MRIAHAPASPSATTLRDTIAGAASDAAGSATDPRFTHFKVIRRNGAVVGFEPDKITIAMTKAFLAVNGGHGAGSARIRDTVANLTGVVTAALMKRKPDGGAIHIEEIQDQVELALMRGGEHEAARAYVLYREKRTQERQQKQQQTQKPEDTTLYVVDDGVRKALDFERLTKISHRFGGLARLGSVSTDGVVATVAMASVPIAKFAYLCRQCPERTSQS